VDLIPLFTRRTTPGQRTVATWTLIVILALTGVVAFYFSAGAGTPADAASLRMIGFCSIGLAISLWIIKRLIPMFVG
jgi:hypothetical protein